MFLFLFLSLVHLLFANASQNPHVGRPNIVLDETTPPYVHFNDLPPRLEWDQNSGYCGEVSLIVAGLYYGQYCSQFTARALGAPGIPQYSPAAQLLFGTTADQAASSMSLNLFDWRGGTSQEFLAWVKARVVDGFPVIIGIFNNEYLMYGQLNPEEGDPEYDHIVVVYGVGSQTPLTDTSYYDTDVLYFHDHGLWSAFRNPPFNFSAQFGSFLLNRIQANALDGPLYSLINNGTNVGCYIQGVTDFDNDTLPVNLKASINYEIPEIVQGDYLENPPWQSNVPPPPIPMTLTATLTIADQTDSYNLYLYNDFSLVPTSNFNAQAGNAIQIWEIPPNSGATYSVQISLFSNEVAVFRAVSTSAP